MRSKLLWVASSILVIVAAVLLHRSTSPDSAGGPPWAAGRPASISWVSTDRESFEPIKGEEVAFRFRVSAGGDVEVRLWDPQERLVRALRQEVEAGDQQIRWDGRDAEGALVPGEAYVYTIHLFPERGDDREVVYDLRGMTGGEPVTPLYTGYDEETGRISFGLPQKSRVHLLATESYVPVATRLDWTPALGGGHEEMWSEKEPGSSPNARGAFLRAMALPENVILVTAPASTPVSGSRIDEEVPYRLEPATTRPQYHHALHPRVRCYDPAVEARVLPDPTGGATLELDVSEEQGAFRAAPDSRVSVHIYVDGKLVAYEPDAFLPYHFRAAPPRVSPGEHEVTAILTWRDEHTGIARTRIRVGAALATD